jgi:hypothetical protein
MKKLILIIALLCISTSALAVEPIDWSKSYALSTAIQAVVSAGGAAAPTYLLSENFDGASACGDGSHTNCQVTWTESGSGTKNYDVAGLETGSDKALSINSTANAGYDYVSIASQSEFWGYFIFQMDTIINQGGFDKFFGFIRDRWWDAVWVSVYPGGTGELCYVIDSAQECTVAQLSADTTYHVWVHYKAASASPGNDGIIELAFSTSAGTKPTSGNNYKAKTNHNTKETCNMISMGGRDATNINTIIFDKIRVDDVEIGASPQ